MILYFFVLKCLKRARKSINLQAGIIKYINDNKNTNYFIRVLVNC
jgi:hypothetical protein